MPVFILLHSVTEGPAQGNMVYESHLYLWCWVVYDLATCRCRSRTLAIFQLRILLPTTAFTTWAAKLLEAVFSRKKILKEKGLRSLLPLYYICFPRQTSASTPHPSIFQVSCNLLLHVVGQWYIWLGMGEHNKFSFACNQQCIQGESRKVHARKMSFPTFHNKQQNLH